MMNDKGEKMLAKDETGKVSKALPALPRGWAWATSSDICEWITNGYTPKAGKMNIGAGEIPFIKIYNLSFDGTLDFSTKPTFISKETHSKELARSIVRPGDVLMNIVGPPLGKISIVPDTFKEWNINQAIVYFRPLSVVDNVFLSFALLTDNIQRWAINTAKATAGQYNISVSTCRNIPIPIPPLPEQQRIVAKIEELFTKLDTGVEALKRVKEQIRRYRQAVLKFAFEGKLTEDWRKAHKDELEPASELLERIKEERKKKAQRRFKELPPIEPLDLPELPEGWVWTRVGEIVDIGTGVTPLRSKKEFYENGRIPWVTSSALNSLFVDNAEEFITDVAMLKTKLKIFPRGSLLVALYGEGKTRGKVSELRIDAATNQACAALIFGELALNCRDYIKHFFLKNYDDIRRLSSGGVQPNLNLSIIGHTAFPLPPLSEQYRIVSEIERRFSIADEVERIIDKSLKQSYRLRQSILKHAFEGKLVPQDPNDEPAERLLERIKAEREKEGAGKRVGNTRKKVR